MHESHQMVHVTNHFEINHKYSMNILRIPTTCEIQAFMTHLTIHWRIQGGGAGRGHGPPRRVGKHPECTRSRHFQTQNRKNSLGRGNAPLQTPASFPLHKFNHNVVSNTLVLSPRAICIHTTVIFPTATVSCV